MHGNQNTNSHHHRHRQNLNERRTSRLAAIETNDVDMEALLAPQDLISFRP
jgi:hypothetical protein